MLSARGSKPFIRQRLDRKLGPESPPKLVNVPFSYFYIHIYIYIFIFILILVGPGGGEGGGHSAAVGHFLLWAKAAAE